jgi:TetR/AcrR family transcriptional repressor of nem operon
MVLPLKKGENRMRNTKAETPKREHKRRQIVEAAYAELAEVGFEGFRMRNVAQRAGLDHATLHHYFEGKDQILVGVMQYIVEDRSIGKFETFTETPPEKRLGTHVEVLLSQMQTNPEMFLVIAEIGLRAFRDANVRQVKATFDAEWRIFLIEIISAAVNVGAFRDDIVPETAADLIMSLVRGAYFTFDGDPEASRPLFDLLLKCLRTS